jgi:hypothetical protein
MWAGTSVSEEHNTSILKLESDSYYDLPGYDIVL